MSPSRTPSGPTVVLVGRPNVGKSTLFNRIAGTRRAIVTAVAGTTRDVIAQPAAWGGAFFALVDTGGMFGASEDPLQDLVAAHGRKAIEGADLIVLVVDGREGLVPADGRIAAEIRRVGCPVLLAINKMDDKRARDRAFEFYELGFEPVLEIAAEHGQGVADLLDEIVGALKRERRVRPAPDARPRTEEPEAVEEGEREPRGPDETRVAIVGRPNVGKSSLVNCLLREERVMVSDLPGTTRDAVDMVLRWHRRAFRIIDTAGIRRPGRVARGGPLEAVSVVIARRAVEKADVAVLVLDAGEGATDQEAAIAGEADEAGCGIVIVVNKWDLTRGRGPVHAKEFDDTLRRQLKFLDYAPVLHVSALTGERVSKVLETIDRVGAARRRRVPTAALNRFLDAVTATHPPASPGRREVRILYAAQTAVAPPTFVIFTNVATKLHFSYERFLKNRLREAFGFEGSPIRLHVRRRASRT